MKCLTPITIKNPRKILSSVDSQYIQVPCKKCTVCLKRRAMQWLFRLQQEHKVCKTAAFMTYTYNQDTLPYSPNGLPTLNQKHHTDYMKRLRKRVTRLTPNAQKLRYYCVGEYGGETERPHYHAILFNLPQSYIDKPHIIADIWTHGIISCDQVTDASIAYVTGYVNKQKFFTTNDPQDDRTKEFSVMSKHIGESFLTPQRTKRLKTVLEPTMRTEDGRIIAVPDYYRRKALTEEENAILAEKCMSYFEENEDFINEQHHIDYVKSDARTRRKNSKQRRKI